MSRQALLARAQAAALAGMVDTCTVRRRTGESTDKLTGAVTPTYSTLYTGICRAQQRGAATAERARDVGEQQVLMLHIEIQLPMSVTGLQLADEVTLSVSQDADLIGRVFFVRDLAHKTDASARRMQCEERMALG